MSTMNNDYQRIMAVAKKLSLQDETLIRNAALLAEKIHKNELRKNGTPFITHPWATARILADMGLDAELIAAALLHDTLEHGGEIRDLKDCVGDSVAELVASVSINKTPHHSGGYQFTFHDSLSELIKEDYRPLYLKLAGRIHNLHTIHKCPQPAQARKIKETEELYLPLAKETHNSYLSILLADACFHAKEAAAYKGVSDAYHNLLSRNKSATKLVKSLFFKVFLQLDSLLNSQNLLQNGAKVYNCIFKQRAIYEIYLEVKPYLNKDKPRYGQAITKYTVPLYDIFLILEQKCFDAPLSFFLSFYKQYLKEESIVITDILTEKTDEPFILLLADRACNQYRLSIFSREYYELYLYGNNPKRKIYLPPRETFAPDSVSDYKITVYTKDHKTKRIAKGATVLDFAFAVHENIGLCAKTAYVNNVEVSLNTVLNESDQVKIVTHSIQGNDIPCAEFIWFEYVKTPRAMNCLVRWFERNYGFVGR